MSVEQVRAVGLSDDHNELWVEVEGDNVEAVRGTAAKQCAIKAAAKEGYSRCGFNQDSGPFIVDENGNPVQALDDMDRMRKESALVTNGKARYRNRIKLMQGIGV